MGWKSVLSDFYPRPPRGGRPKPYFDMQQSGEISIHALREEGDTRGSATLPWPVTFLSTPSARRATGLHWVAAPKFNISIHALREEGDLETLGTIPPFQCISIHALREEGDAQTACPSLRSANFYPRPPRGGRRQNANNYSQARWNFYPRPPRGGRHPAGIQPANENRFLSTPSARRATIAPFVGA